MIDKWLEECKTNAGIYLLINRITICVKQRYICVSLDSSRSQGEKERRCSSVPRCPTVPIHSGTGQWDSGTRAITNYQNKVSHEQLFITEV